MIEVVINNEVILVAPSETLFALIEQQNIPTEGLAAAINEVVIPKASWAVHKLQHQDQILLFRAIAGG